MAADEDALSSPAWHEAELKKTEAEFAAGKVEVLDWAAAKKELRQRFRMKVQILRYNSSC